MMIFQMVAFALMAVFYGVYLIKQVSQRRQGIRTNQMGRGGKPSGTLAVERMLSVFSVLIIGVELWSVWSGYSLLPVWFGWIGLVLTALGVVFFTAAVLRQLGASVRCDLHDGDIPPSDSAGRTLPSLAERHQLRRLLPSRPEVFMNMPLRTMLRKIVIYIGFPLAASIMRRGA